MNIESRETKITEDMAAFSGRKILEYEKEIMQLKAEQERYRELLLKAYLAITQFEELGVEHEDMLEGVSVGKRLFLQSWGNIRQIEKFLPGIEKKKFYIRKIEPIIKIYLRKFLSFFEKRKGDCTHHKTRQIRLYV